MSDCGSKGIGGMVRLWLSLQIEKDFYILLDSFFVGSFCACYGIFYLVQRRVEGSQSSLTITQTAE